MIIYLYIKQHLNTGLKYFGKTIKNPYDYQGSGVYWNRHLDTHGRNNVATLNVWQFDNQEECTEFALDFSKSNNIVQSKEWANLMEENGISGGRVENNHCKIINSQPRSDQWKLSQSQNKKGKVLTPNSYTPKAKAKIANTLKSYPIVQCPRCGKHGKNFGRFKGSHFENCKTA
jgi:hypothetical protein